MDQLTEEEEEDFDQLTEEEDFDIDVQGVPMPAWLMSRPDQVIDVRFSDGRVVCFERFTMLSQTCHCTWPRYANLITPPDPEHECHWSHPTYDEEVMIEHAWTHVHAP